MYAEYVSIYTNHSITQEARQCIQKRYLYIQINQLHRGGKTMYTEEVPIYIPINQLHRGGKTVYREEVPIYTNQSITQRR